ncbi:hypothetical protein LZQ00_08265 [Sphingobacterium sp. SRCM116780]|uniref:hypothetical protein n=1 Tax=Sphingobacterium sp. SRCM116780 TaxID=2907623 RepID=UPI001F2331B2|nr:hypothetical protein [Sphingobacterium sp. SRCM116780]UIR57801.1 hypothetical protein LZQ00_08265 [Sphingobacterium sp. SRCM116780]
MLIIETFTATLKHDHGKRRLTIVSLSGEEGAIKQITMAENCPRIAIKNLKKISTHEIL